MLGEKRKETERESGSRELERKRGKWTRTPRLRTPVGTPGETGDWRSDGRKPEAGEGAGPGSGGVTGKPVAKMGGKKHDRHVSVVMVLSSKMG